MESILLGLPVETVISILKWLDCRQILLCSSVCKTLREIVKESVELQYQIELAADGMVDGPPGLMTTADRLELLLDRRRRWRMLDWTRRVTVPIPGACQAYELAGGVFAKSMRVGDVDDGVDKFRRMVRHLTATWLPSRTKEAQSIIREELDVATGEFTIDPSQDLIVLVNVDYMQPECCTINVHLRTISTNTAHLGAASSQLRAEISSDPGMMSVQVVDDVVGVICWASLVIWNWVTAEVLVYYPLDDLPSREFDFLSNRAFMIMVPDDPGSIEIYSFSGHAPLSVFPPLPPTHITTLCMPAVQAGRELSRFSTHSGRCVRNTAPFASARDSRVHFMSIQYNSHGPRFYLFLYNHFLLSLVPPGFGSGEVWTTLTRPWDSWGPAHTRLLEHNASFGWGQLKWFRYAHGQRVVLPPLSISPNPPSTLYVLHFNIHPTRTDDPVPTAESRRATWQYEVVTGPTTIPAGTVFRADVVTHLPYSMSSCSGLSDYSGFMIDDERILGMKSLPYTDDEMNGVDVFTF
ncbi:hypothetical protein B0H21DRAFT_487066 [Amylocystis lapponica]|nr:hypothetical protein B0H21DRAFT_487066 [Amylocystis lapponica]